MEGRRKREAKVGREDKEERIDRRKHKEERGMDGREGKIRNK